MMRLVWIVICILFSYPAEAISWKSIEPGLSYVQKKYDDDVGYDTNPVILHVFKISLQHFDIKPLIASNPKSVSIKKLVESHQAIIGINANFFDPKRNPLGLVIKDGKASSGFKKISWWAVFALKKNEPEIIHSSQFKKSRQIKNAIQAGPRLVINGKIPNLKSETSAKSAVAITKDKQVLIVITQNSLDIRKLAKILKNDFKVMNALNLDGGSSSQLYAQIGNFKLNLPSFVQIPVGLGIFRTK